MHSRLRVLLALLACSSSTALAQSGRKAIEPYPLPEAIAKDLSALAANSDVLLLGELHGTRETPALAAALLDPLTKQGYGVLALEVPSDQRRALINWADGKTELVPPFFAHPSVDGRGSAEALSLIHIALSPPRSWKLICFDASEMEMMQAMQGLLAKAPPQDPAATDEAGQMEQMMAITIRRDAIMAANFAAQLKEIADEHRPRVLVICGNLHARVEHHPKPDQPWASFWPCFASNLRNEHADWRVNSIDVRPQRGRFYNGGRENTLNGKELSAAELRLTPDAAWTAGLKLPQATAATFLSPPALDLPPRSAR